MVITLLFGTTTTTFKTDTDRSVVSLYRYYYYAEFGAKSEKN